MHSGNKWRITLIDAVCSDCLAMLHSVLGEKKNWPSKQNIPKTLKKSQEKKYFLLFLPFPTLFPSPVLWSFLLWPSRDVEGKLRVWRNKVIGYFHLQILLWSSLDPWDFFSTHSFVRKCFRVDLRISEICSWEKLILLMFYQTNNLFLLTSSVRTWCLS